jgi:enoyl-CoA hydratase
MAYETLLFDVTGGLARVTINRPDKLNALNGAVLRDLGEAADAVARDVGIRAVILTGAGSKAFVAGADIAELTTQGPMDGKARAQAGQAIFRAFEHLNKPVIAAVNGFALGGGCELAMACDLLVAADDAVFGQPEIKLGVIPGAGGTQRLTRALGKARAMEVILTGRNVPAREAEVHGLVTQLVPREATVPAALELAARIAAMPPLAVMAAKEAVNRAFELSLEAGLEFERRNFFLLFGSDDQREGMAAFLEKRTPDFKGR